MSLIELVEDATGITYGRFYREETTEAVMDCFGRYVGQHGLPCALYVDQDSIYVVNTGLTTTSGSAGERWVRTYIASFRRRWT